MTVFLDREDAAKAMIHTFDLMNKVEQFLKDILRNEVLSATETHTLFRGNSMASKAVDVYMKYVGLGYMKETIGPVMKLILTSNKNCEVIRIQYLMFFLKVDPSRLEKTDNISNNWKNLLAYAEALVENIFASVDKFPT